MPSKVRRPARVTISLSKLLFAAIGGLATAGAGVVGCGDNLPTDRLLFETEHFRYYATGGNPVVCDRAPYWLERVYAGLSEYLGLTLPVGSRIDYHLVGEMEIPSRCGKAITGCTDGLRVTSMFAIYNHEIVHAIVNSRLGGAPAIFGEGLAVMLGCGYPQSLVVDTSAPIELLLTSSEFFREHESVRSDLYAVAGSFVRHVIDTVGKETFLRFYDDVSYYADGPAIETAFFAASGVPLADMIKSWRARPRRLDDLCLYPVECAEGLVTPPNTLTLTSGCGPTGDSRLSEVMVPFEVGPNGRILLDVDGIPASAVTSSAAIYRCAGGNVTGSSGGVSDYFLNVPAGQYFYRVGWNGDPSNLSLRFAEVSAPQGTGACLLSGTPLTLQPGRRLQVARRWVSPAGGGFPWSLGAALDIVPSAPGRLLPTGVWTVENGVNGPTDFYLCDTACPSAPESACVKDAYGLTAAPGTTFQILNRLVEAGQTLHLATGPNSPDDIYSFSLFLAAP